MPIRSCHAEPKTGTEMAGRRPHRNSKKRGVGLLALQLRTGLAWGCALGLITLGCGEASQPAGASPKERLDAAGGAAAADHDGGPDDEAGHGGDGRVDAMPDGGSADAGEDVAPWSASVGTWCGPGEGGTTWLVANPDWLACKFRSQYVYGDSGESEDGFSLELPSNVLQQLPGELNLAARWCNGGVCETLPATLWLEAYDADVGARGRWQIALNDGTHVGGEFDSDWCLWDDYLPAHPDAARLARGLRLHEIALFQVVKVPIMQRLLEVTERNAGIVAGRPALLRAYVVPELGWLAKPVRARLTLLNRDPSGQDEAAEVFDQTMTVVSASSDAALESTFNFSIPSESIREDTRYMLELLETKPCAALEGEPNGARFPEAGMLGLGARAIGKLRVQLVPVHYELAGNLLAPDTSAEQVERFRRAITRLFPITGTEITVRDQPVVTTSSVMADVLDQITALRDQENPERDVSYYGLVRLTETLAEYCATPCVLGAAVIGETGLSGATGGTAVGVGYNGDQAAHTFAHEMGHVYGRIHAPCNVQGDPDYPYRSGGIGTWGYDQSAGTLVDPSSYKDFMGYCSPVWVSDYTYARLQSFIADVNQPTSPSPLVNRGRWRTLILESGTAPRWGLSREVWGEPSGVKEQAHAHDASGNVLASLTVYRDQVADLGLEFVYVPEPQSPAWATVGVRGQTPHSYHAPLTVPPLTRAPRP
jgi:hypothetical protein